MGLRQAVLRPLTALILGCVVPVIVVPPAMVRAAEEVHFSYGPFDFTVSVDSLEAFAQNGQVGTDLALFVNRLKPNQKEQLRQFLTARYQFSPVLIAQFFYSSLGETFLHYLGELIQGPHDQNGFYGIRSALIQSTADPEGLTAINFIRNYPTLLRLNTEHILRQFSAIQSLTQETRDLLAALEAKAVDQDDRDATPNFLELPPLQSPGQVTYELEVFKLNDRRRQREFTVNLYRPQRVGEHPTPVIIITNGLATRLDRYDYLAEHLASHGFAVAILQHVDSDDVQQQQFLQGLSSELFQPSAFVDRPLDITFLLDSLEQLNASQFEGQLNLQGVGIFGNSFGGDTALAVAGAKINFAALEQACDPTQSLVNLSLLVQCQALKVPSQPYNFRDRRIKAVSVLFPSSSGLYGEAGLSQVKVPVLWGAVTKDVFSSLALEQSPSFQWLGSDDKYFVVAKGLDHLNLNFFALRTLRTTDQESAKQLMLQEPESAKSYLKALNLAFFQVYLANQEQFKAFLTPAYAQTMGDEHFSLIFLKQWAQSVSAQ